MNALEIKGLQKKFKDFSIDNIDLTLPQGCIVGLVGENGAGKTTTIKLILDMIKKDGGSISVFGKDNEKNAVLLREDIGVVLDEVGIPECLNARQVGRIMKHTFRNWNGEEYFRLIAKLSIPEKKPFKDYSRGMKMKLGIAVALSHGAKLLLLDEPTAGLDPKGRDDILDQIAYLHKESDMTVILVSHSMEDIARYADRIIVMNKGKVMYNDRPENVFAHYQELEQVGLAAPQVTYIMHDLKEKGFAVNTQVTTVEEAADQIMAALEK